MIVHVRSPIVGKVGLGACLALLASMVWAQQSASPLSTTVPTLFEPIPAGGPLTMRRLTESQYRQTIADVFAPDVTIAGRFERGLRHEGLIAAGTSLGGLSAFSLEQYDVSARSIAAEVTSEKRRAQFVPCAPKAENLFDKDCAARFVDAYGLKLFRRPLSRDERDRLLQVARTAQEKLGGFYRGLEYALVGMLESPNFLLRMERAIPDPLHPGSQSLDAWSKAERLSYFLTNSTPDDELLRAAAAGELETEAGLARQVDRMISSPRIEAGVRAFFWDMLQFDGFNDLFKDPAIYPAYNSDVARDAQEQTLRTIVTLLVQGKRDYREIFTTRTTWMTRPLGIIYRMPVATRNGWQEVAFPEGSPRAGILTDVSMLALHSHPGRSSPTLRGRSLREIFLCQKVPDPPANVNFSIVQDAVNKPGSTARLRLAEHAENPVCAGCHALTDPLGLTLENFDGAGGFRNKENGADLDLSGELGSAEFVGPQGLGRALYDDPGTATCLSDKLYRSAVGRDVVSAEKPYLGYLAATFKANGYRVTTLMRTIALSKGFSAVSPPLEPSKTRAATNPAKRDRT